MSLNPLAWARARSGPVSPGHRAMRLAMLAIALGVAAIVHLRGADLPVARQLEAHSRDLLMRLAASDGGDPRIAIVDIDEESLERVGPWPWPREKLADLAEKLLSEGGAAIVAFDLVLPEPSPPDKPRLGDERLASLADQGWLVAAQAFDYVRRERAVMAGKLGGAIAAPGGTRGARATGFVANFDQLAGGRCVGNIGFVPDSDGKVRRIAPWTRWGDALYPAYAISILQCALPHEDAARWAAQLPVDAKGAWSIPFLHRPEGHLAIPAEAVLSGGFLESLPAAVPGLPAQRPLAGRIVLVGSSALGLADRVATPLSSSVSGVTVHVAALSAMLDLRAGASRGPPPRWAMPAWVAVSVLLLWVAIVVGGRLRLVLAGAALTLGVWSALAAWMTLTSAVQPVSAALWGYAAILLQFPVEWSWAHARVRARTRLLSRYVAKEVLDELLAEGKDDPLVPRNAEITVLIADMEDYTRLTSHSTLQAAADLTRGFLEQLTAPVLEHRGTLDRYTGDGLVSFWGAPIAVADHADPAIDAAMAILRNVERFNAERRARGEPPATARIGIASGFALVGDLGTRFRVGYTAVGDCINLASRLQQQSRELGANVVVSSSARERSRRWRFESLGTVSVRGLPDQEVFKPLEDRPPAGSPPGAREA